MGFEYLGRGIVSPFQRDGKGDFANMEGLDLLNADIDQLLHTRGQTPNAEGELPWRTALGSRLYLLKHKGIPNEAVRALAIDMTGETIRRWESRVRVGQTTIEEEKSKLKIFIRYKVLGYNVREPGRTVVEIER